MMTGAARCVPAMAAVLLTVCLAACGGPSHDSDPIDMLPPREGVYGTALTIGDLEARVWPQLTTNPDPPRGNIEFTKYQDRRERINSIEMRVPIDAPESLIIRYYIESREAWDVLIPVVRTTIFVEELDPLTQEPFRTPIHTHAAVLAEMPWLQDFPGMEFDFMPLRDQFGDVITLIAEAETMFARPGSERIAIEPNTLQAPPEASTRILSNPLRIEFERRTIPDRPLILLPEEQLEEQAAAEEQEAEGAEP